jgi:hypothetical protein
MIVYDTEIVNMIPGKRGEPVVPGVNYCKGWTDFHGMGLAVLCAYNYETDRWHVFLKDNLQEFQKLVDKTELLIGFNNHSFDDLLIRANGIQFELEASLDLRTEILRGLGMPMDKAKYVKGFSLPGLGEANFGVGKSDDGALAPALWQRGEIGRVIDYCLNDVKITKMLVDKIIKEGGVYDPREENCGCVANMLTVDITGPRVKLLCPNCGHALRVHFANGCSVPDCRCNRQVGHTSFKDDMAF